jgi:hypothetical protein
MPRTHPPTRAAAPVSRGRPDYAPAPYHYIE